MNNLAKRIWLALALLGTLHFTAAAASATPTLSGANVFDGYYGGYNAYPESQPCGSFHLYVIEGTDPYGAIVNDNSSLNIPLSLGTHTFTLLGTEGPNTSQINFGDPSSLPAVTLNLSDGAASGSLTIAHGSSGSLVLGTNTVSVTSFSWTPYDQSSVNRVGTCGIGGDSWYDAIGQFTIEVSPPPPVLTQIQVLGPPGGWLTQPNGDGGIFNLYLYDQHGAILNPDGLVNYALPDGTYTLTLRATDRADGPVFYLNMWLNGNYSGPVDIAVSTASPLGSAVLGGKSVTVTSFTWLNGGQPDMVSVDYPAQPDGYSDSVGEFTIEVHTEATPPPPPPPSGPVHRWAANGDASDAIGSAHGTLGGTTAFAGGVAGQAFTFDAQESSIIALPVDINPAALPQMTVGMWVKLRTRANDQGWVFGHDDGGYDRSLNLHDARYGYGVAGGTGVEPHYSPLQLSLNEWHFVAAVYDRDQATATYYADGAWQTVYANPGSAHPTTTLGGLAQFMGHTVNGLVDEVVLFDRALTPQELDQLRSEITPPEPQPPVADAGPDQTAVSGQVVQLDGSQSSDPDHQALSYHWHNFYSPISSYTPPDWVPITLSGADTPTPAFVAPAPGTYYFALVVDNGIFQRTATTTVTVMAANQPPVADAGPDQTVEGTGPLTSVTLNGTGSSDPDGDALSYSWSANGTEISTTASPVVSLAQGLHTFTLTVNDGQGETAVDEVVVNLVDTTAPVVTAPAAITIEATGPQTTVAIGAATATDAIGVVSISSNAPTTFPVGTTLVTWTATDAAGNAGSATQQVLVRDTTAPVVTAALTAINRSRDDDEDGNTYRVTATATDAVDPHPVVSALITQPLTSSTSMVVSYKREKKNSIEVKMERRRLQVKLEGPSESALRALWAQVLATGGFAATNGQEVQLAVKKDKKEEYEAQYQLDKTLKLTSAKGPGLKLAVWATDVAGNQSPRVEVVPGKRARSDRDDRDDRDDDDRHAKLVGNLPVSFGLEANYPNPFNPSTTLRYNLVEAGQVQLTVYNVMGQQIRVLVDQVQQAGAYQIEWNSQDEVGQPVAPGLYLYRLVSGNQAAVGKMLLVK